MNMQITMQNKNNAEYEAMLNDLVQEAFHFTFAPWHALKLWDERYESYSIVENGRIQANICIYKMDMLIGGKRVRVNQLGSVATRAENRKQGLSRILMEHIFNIYEDVPAMLYANSTVLHFYPRFAFKRVYENTPMLYYIIDNKDLAQFKLSPNDNHVIDIMDNRFEYSKIMDIENIQPVHRFHLLQNYSSDIYSIPALDAIIIAKQTDAKLYLPAVFSKKPLNFQSLAGHLPFTGIKKVEFGFCPDWLEVAPAWEIIKNDEIAFFIRGKWELPVNFKFPALSSI